MTKFIWSKVLPQSPHSHMPVRPATLFHLICASCLLLARTEGAQCKIYSHQRERKHLARRSP